MIARRTLLALAATAPWPARAQTGVTLRALAFPRDHGAHPDTRTEWWYATGWLQDAPAPGVATHRQEGAGTPVAGQSPIDAAGLARAAAASDPGAIPAWAGGAPAFGFQLTFFRSRTGLAGGNTSRFAARQLLFAHAALTDLGTRRLLHAERIARWNGDEHAPRAAASLSDTRVHIGAWRFERDAGDYRATLGDEAAGFAYRLALAPTQALLLQGDAGYSRKGPDAAHASHYYSQPQLAVSGELKQGDAPARAVRGMAWLDHEWSEALLPGGAVGWDWIGINLADAGALTAFRLRRADGSAVWAGGSHRSRAGTTRIFGADEVRFEALAHWTSAATLARYPVRWRVHTPAGAFEVRALLDAQELDGRASTGTVYWEGLAELVGSAGERVGLGYLEMTGYAGPLRL